MKDCDTSHSIGKEKQILEPSPVSHNHLDDRYKGHNSEDLYKEERNSQQFQSLSSEQVCDDGGATRPTYLPSCSKKTAASHKSRTDHSGYAKSCLLSIWETPQEVALIPPSADFNWTQDDFFSLYYKNSYSGIQIRPLEWGVYLIILGNGSLVEVPTLRQALAICHTIAWIFKDSLPVPRRYVNIDDKKPF